MRKKLKKRFINKIKRKGRDLEQCLLCIRISDSLEEAKEMRRLTKVKNRHKIQYLKGKSWLRWEMFDMIVKRTGRRLGATNTLPSWYRTK